MLIEKKLPNGLELIIRQTNAPVAAVQVWVDVGSLDEKPNEAGFCHFLEHMLFKGTKKRSTSDIAGAVESSGGEMNAFTSFEYTVYYITLSNERWKLANEILSDMVLASEFYPKEFTPEKEVILEEIKRGEDSPDRQLYRGAYEMLYGSHGYGRPVIGFPKTVRACTASTLKNFWRRWYTPSLMTVVVTGDVNPEAVEKEVLKTWGRAKPRFVRERRRETGFSQKIFSPKKLQQSKSFDVNSVKWVGALPACTLQDEILPALDVAGMILGQSESSRLYHRLFREEKVVTSIGSGVWAPAGTGMFSFNVDVPIEKASKFRKILREEIEKFCDEGPTVEELQRAKVTVETDRVYGSQTMDALANRLGYLRTSIGNTRFDLDYLAMVRDVTAEDVRDAARTYLKLDQMREFALVPKNFDAPSLWGAAPAYVKTSSKKRPQSAEESSLQKIDLDNGIQLVLNHRKDVPVVSFHACSLAGLRVEDKSTAGLGNVLADVWDKGPKGWTSNRFAQFLDSFGASIGAFSGRNSVGMSATMLTHQVDDILPVFTETLLNPELSQHEFEHSRAVALEDIRTIEDDGGRLVGKLFVENLFEPHPYGFPIIGTAQSVSGFTHDKLVSHFDRWVRSAPIVVGVSGKFSVDKTIKYFSQLKRARVGAMSPPALEFSGLKAPRVAEIHKGREQSHLIYGFTGLRIGEPDAYTLKVLLTVLSGQSGRLFTELRDKQGLCYTVAPLSFEGIEPGYVGVYMGCDPSKRERALTGIRLELDKIMSKKITPAELSRAKEFILGRNHMDMQLNNAISQTIAFNALYGVGYDAHLQLDQNIRKVTAADIQRVAKRIFGSPSVTAVTI